MLACMASLLIDLSNPLLPCRAQLRFTFPPTPPPHPRPPMQRSVSTYTTDVPAYGTGKPAVPPIRFTEAGDLIMPSTSPVTAAVLTVAVRDALGQAVQGWLKCGFGDLITPSTSPVTAAVLTVAVRDALGQAVHGWLSVEGGDQSLRPPPPSLPPQASLTL